MDNFSKELRGIEDVCPSCQSGTLRKKIVCTKKAHEIDSVTSIWWNDFYELQKKYWRPYFLFNLLPTLLKRAWIFYIWDIFLDIYSIWTLSLLLWMQLWLNMFRFVCGFPHFLISWTLMKQTSFYVLKENYLHKA